MKPGTIDPNADVHFMDLDDLREEHDRLSDRLAAVARRIWELEQEDSEAELREMRSEYYRAVIGRYR